MSRRKKRQAREEKASPDLTPMIDVTFQLLIFFILATRFKVDERNHKVELPKDEGLESTPSVPKEQVTIRCEWDEANKSNQYVVALDARALKVVPNSLASLEQMVIFPYDTSSAIIGKKDLYKQVFSSLVVFTEDYIVNSGANIEKLEISFAVNAMRGAVEGTAPWMFVSLAIDAAAQINKNRVANGLKELIVTFKFADSRQVYSR
jgi:biopolymer transport protein ExbD